jgi:hypothetical protein
MQVINRRNVQVRSERNLPYVSVQKESLYFTQATVEQFDMRIGMYVQFLNDDKSWFFFLTDDPDGFVLGPMSAGLRIHSGPLVRMIKQQFKVNAGQSFYLHETPRNIKGAKLIEIAFGSPVIKIVSKPRVAKS